MFQILVPVVAALCSIGCDSPRERQARDFETDVCRIAQSAQSLPAEARETSGLAVSSHDADVLWTHNDRGNEPVLYAVGADGALRGRTVVTGAGLTDWEDIASGACAAGHCLYIGDIGDNDGDRESITIYEVTEPAPGTTATEPARALYARYPDGPHNAEALFMLPGGDLYIVTKDERAPAALYRYPNALRGADIVTLEHVRALPLPRRDSRDVVTGASASVDGQWIAIRTYTMLHFLPARALLETADLTPLTVDLRPLGEAQGEGVAMGAAGTVWLSSEAEDGGSPQRARLTCTLAESKD